jgi:hypothetical protein
MFESIKTRVEHMFGTDVRTPYAVSMPEAHQTGLTALPPTLDTGHLTCRNGEAA